MLRAQGQYADALEHFSVLSQPETIKMLQVLSQIKAEFHKGNLLREKPHRHYDWGNIWLTQLLIGLDDASYAKLASETRTIYDLPENKRTAHRHLLRRMGVPENQSKRLPAPIFSEPSSIDPV
ncbi:hypothetical protein BH10PSE19_BH10PSE19_01290 [soil metagenome]